MIKAIKKIKGGDGIMWLGGALFIQVGQARPLWAGDFLRQAWGGKYVKIWRKPIVGEGLQVQRPWGRMSVMCLKYRVKCGWRLLSNLVTHASGKVQKSQILQGGVAHTEGFEFYTQYKGSYWKILCRTEMIPFVFLKNHCSWYKGIISYRALLDI